MTTTISRKRRKQAQSQTILLTNCTNVNIAHPWVVAYFQRKSSLGQCVYAWERIARCYASPINGAFETVGFSGFATKVERVSTRSGSDGI